MFLGVLQEQLREGAIGGLTCLKLCPYGTYSNAYEFLGNGWCSGYSSELFRAKSLVFQTCASLNHKYFQSYHDEKKCVCLKEDCGDEARIHVEVKSLKNIESSCEVQCNDFGSHYDIMIKDTKYCACLTLILNIWVRGWKRYKYNEVSDIYNCVTCPKGYYGDEIRINSL